MNTKIVGILPNSVPECFNCTLRSTCRVFGDGEIIFSVRQLVLPAASYIECICRIAMLSQLEKQSSHAEVSKCIIRLDLQCPARGGDSFGLPFCVETRERKACVIIG